MLKEIKDKIKDININKYIMYCALICTYIIPLGLLDSSYRLSKAIFLLIIVIAYFYNIKKIQKQDYLFIILLIIMTLITRKYNFMTFICLPIAKIFIEDNKTIKELPKSIVLYICLVFSIFYTIIYWGTDGRFAFTAIQEINQSGLALFCLGLLLLKKNKKVGILTLFWGLFTFSRSYFIAIALFLISLIPFTKKIINKIKPFLFNYAFLNLISLLAFLGLAFSYIYFYKNGLIVSSEDSVNRLFSLLDYSNFFRFTTILYLFIIMFKWPKTILFGMDDNLFNLKSYMIAKELGLPFRVTPPHNLFLSHLKMYGFIAIIEVVYLNSILKKIVNKNNCLIYLAIILYSFILGAGLYNYWLFLSLIVIINYSEENFKPIKEAKNKIKISLSFDDGRKDTYRMFYEILKKYNIPFTLNVTSGYISKTIKKEDWPSDNTPMSKSQLIKLSKEELVEISGHGKKHNNDIKNFEEGIIELREVLEIKEKIGIASPQCRFNLNNISEYQEMFKKNKVLYLRVGDRFDNLAFIKKVLRRFNRVLKNSWIYYFVYKQSEVRKEDNFVLHSAIVTKYDTLKNIKYFIEKAIKNNKSYIFMYHSILKPNEDFYTDTYSWDYNTFVELCKYLKELEKNGNIEIVMVKDMLK